jgi:hypothetical protein
MWLLMQIAAEVRRVLHKNPAKVKLSDFLLKTSAGGPGLDLETATKVSKGRWTTVLKGLAKNAARAFAPKTEAGEGDDEQRGT